MKKVNFKMAEQVGNFGLYGNIEMTCKVTKEYKKVVITFENKDDSKWYAGILFGAYYFLEHYVEQVGLEINITNVESNDVDTSNVIIAYITINALTQAVEKPLTKKITFSKETMSFIFPK